MIRGGPFGIDFTAKLVWIAIGIALVVWDVRTRRRLDAVWVLLTGAVLISGMEGYLQMSGDRV